MRTSKQIIRIAEIILAEGDYQYIHDPDHRNKPHGKFWPTDKGWSNDPKDAPQQQTGAYPYKLTPMDNEYFEAIKSGNTEAISGMVSQRAKEAGYTSGKLLHGSPKKDIKTFDTSESGSNGEKGGIFFTDNPKLADRFSHEQIPSEHSDLFVKMGQQGKVYSGFLKMNNPLDLREMTSEKANILRQIIKKNMGLNKTEQQVMEDASAPNKSLIKLYLPTTNLQRLKDYGYDGYIAPISDRDGGGSEYVVLDSEQIKSADPIVKDDAGNIIPLSQRFNPNSKDIRY